MLQISLETVCYIILKAREFDVKEDVVEDDLGSNPADDGEMAVLADYPDDPVYDELVELIDSLNDDERTDLVALAWLGRDDSATAQDWPDLVAEARQEGRGSTARYLLGMPLLPDYLEEGLARLGLSCEDFEAQHL
ncbi:MAG: DUF3775 domain-containing protein [Alphaproteobacteria bacterium]|nr:MAG: DUF3775 domain-containing protein [Alphaproteobacteria bacterium]